MGAVTGGSYDLQIAQVGDAGFHQRQVHFDEVVLDAAYLCRSEDSVPVECALAYGDDLARLFRPALDVHGDEAAGVFREVLGCVVSIADGGYLELEFDKLWIE